jgi:hypothetical protein
VFTVSGCIFDQLLEAVEKDSKGDGKEEKVSLREDPLQE